MRQQAVVAATKDEPITDESVSAAFDDENKASMDEFVKGITPLVSDAVKECSFRGRAF